MLRLQAMGVDITMDDLIAQVQQQMVDPNLPRGAQTNVELDAPLLQLFLQTLLPWSNVGNPPA